MSSPPGGDRRGSSAARRVLDRVAALRHGLAGTALGPAASADELSALRTRVNHLEAALEGLQDAVYRDAQRHDEEIAALQRQTQPENIARALSGDARRRGL